MCATLLDMLDTCKEVATRERAKQEEAELNEICDMEEHGENYALALELLEEDRENNAADACEEALRLGIRLDDEDNDADSRAEALDAEIARKVATAEQLAATADERLKGKVEASDAKLAQKIAARLRVEAVRTAKLEMRQKKLVQKTLAKEDTKAVQSLLQEIDAEESALQLQEIADAKLAKKYCSVQKREYQKQQAGDMKLARKLSREDSIGEESVSLRSMLRCKLGTLRNDITNRMEKVA